jgi:hypothetical protein
MKHRRFHLPLPHTPGRRTRYAMPLFIKWPGPDHPLDCHKKFKVGASHNEFGGRECAAQVGGTFSCGQLHGEVLATPTVAAAEGETIQ